MGIRPTPLTTWKEFPFPSHVSDPFRDLEGEGSAVPGTRSFLGVPFPLAMTVTRFASALSTRSDGTLALREATEELRRNLGGRSPDLVVVFVSPHHAPDFGEMAARLGNLTKARVLVGCCGESVIGGPQEVERGPALSLWAVACKDLDLHPFKLRAHPLDRLAAEFEGGNKIVYSGHPDFARMPSNPGDSLLLFGDPYSFPASDYLEILHREAPGLAVTGGMASGARQRGNTALFLGGERLNHGAVGVLLRGGIELTNVISHAHRPVGRPWVITSSEGAMVKKLGGRAASRVMMDTLGTLSPREQLSVRAAPVLGVAWDASRREFDPSDFLAHPIRSLLPKKGAIVLTGEVRRGQTVQFMIRDAHSAGEDLETRLRRYAGPPPSRSDGAGALIFTCTGRGRRMFDEPNHDAGRVQAHLGEGVPVSGFFAGGEIGFLGDRNQLQGFTASMAVYRAR